MLLKHVRQCLGEQGRTLYDLAYSLGLTPPNLHNRLSGKTYIEDSLMKALAKELQEEEETLLSLVTISKVLYKANIDNEGGTNV